MLFRQNKHIYSSYFIYELLKQQKMYIITKNVTESVTVGRPRPEPLSDISNQSLGTGTVITFSDLMSTRFSCFPFVYI